MAHKKGGGTTKNNRDSKPKNLGFKRQHNNFVNKGEIILKQRGQNFKCGINTSMSKDFSIFSIDNGFINITKNIINIVPYL